MKNERCHYCGSDNVEVFEEDGTKTTLMCGECTGFWSVYTDINERSEYNDNVSHPKHYASGLQVEVECIMFTRWMSFNIGNAFKYIWRAGMKDSLKQDLEKALWYLDDAKEYDINEKHYDLVDFLPKFTKEGWKYQALRCILTGGIDGARYVISSTINELTSLSQ
jgi:hypothetical protein